MTPTTSQPEQPATGVAGASTVPPSPRSGFPVWRVALLAPLVAAVPWLAVTVGSGLPPQLTAVSGAVLALLIVVTTTTDLQSRRIPNWATYTAALWGLGLPIVAVIVPGSWAVTVPGVFGTTEVPLPQLLAGVTLGDAVAGFAVGFGVMFLLYGVFQGGAGDVKLVAASGALVGIDNIFQVLVYGYVIAAVCAACWLVLAGGAGGLFREVGKGLAVAKPAEPATPVLQQRIPMAPFLNAGVLLALFWRGL